MLMLRQKNTKDVIINKEGSRMIKDGEDWISYDKLETFKPNFSRYTNTFLELLVEERVIQYFYLKLQCNS